MKFEWYSSLASAVARADEKALLSTWNTILGVAARPWSSIPANDERLDGHIPFDLSPHVWKRAPGVYADRGIYLWGAWSGDAARIQYVGVADAKSLAERFGKRYAYELRAAVRYEALLRTLSEAASAKHGSINLQRYIDIGIRINKNTPTRMPRSERYAKVGLRNLWHFVIPAPPVPDQHTSSEPQDKVLRAVETSLIQLANAELFRMNGDGMAGAFPTVNRTDVMRNPKVPDASRTAYDQWLFDGTWWDEMNLLVRSSDA